MKIDKENIEKEIAALTKKTSANEKVEIIFRVDHDNHEIVFSGHIWGSFCEYAEVDLCNNGDFKIVRSPYSDYAVFGSSVRLTKSEMRTLLELQMHI